MPKIVAYVHAYVPVHNAGAETTIHDILKHLVSLGWEADVVIKENKASGDDYTVDGVNVHISHDKRTLLHYLPKADITISHLECSERTHLLSNAYKIPTVHLVHNTHRLTKKWMQPADALVINTDWIANEEGFKDFPHPKIVVNPPVDPGEYKTNRGKCVTLVNLWEDKGAAIFYHLARKFPGIPFLGVKGGYGIQEIEELPNVTIMDHTSNMKDVYSQTKVLIMPSKYESFGRVGVEAMASGIPVLAHPTEGLRESLSNAGTFASRETPEEWETALRELLKPAKYGKMSKLALARSAELDKNRISQLLVVEPFFNELIRVTKTR